MKNFGGHSGGGGRIIFGHSLSNARDVGILLKKGLNIKILHLHKDEEGRLVAVEAKYELLKIILANIYAPNTDDADFFVSTCDKISAIPIDLKIVGGDFNMIRDINIDKSGGKAATHIKACKILEKFILAEDLVDIWRFQHPYDHTYTWYRKKPELIQCRLDYFLLPRSMISLCCDSAILPSFMSDHSQITITLELENLQKGPGFWKLNVSLLDDTNYLELIRQTIKSVLKLSFQDVRTKWDYMKLKLTR